MLEQEVQSLEYLKEKYSKNKVLNAIINEVKRFKKRGEKLNAS